MIYICYLWLLFLMNILSFLILVHFYRIFNCGWCFIINILSSCNWNWTEVFLMHWYKGKVWCFRFLFAGHWSKCLLMRIFLVVGDPCLSTVNLSLKVKLIWPMYVCICVGVCMLYINTALIMHVVLYNYGMCICMFDNFNECRFMYMCVCVLYNYHIHIRIMQTCVYMIQQKYGTVPSM